MNAPVIVASLTVKNEHELIGRTIAHLRAIGVDLIIACDMFSTDGTAGILEAERSAGDLWLVQMSDSESHEYWEREMRDLIRAAAADWAIFVDADEFPIPASGSLKDCSALQDADVLRIPRLNVPLGPKGPKMPDELVPRRHDELLLLVERPDFWKHLGGHDPLSATAKPIKPKAMARTSCIREITVAAHDVVGPKDRPPRRTVPLDLLTAHLPVTTRERFARKVDNIRELLALHPDLYQGQAAQHWRTWVSAADHGRLDEEFDLMTFDSVTLEDLRERRVIESAFDIFAAQGSVGGD